MINFSLSDLRLICDSATFGRGYDYNEAAYSEIKSVTMVSDEIMQISATTVGSKLYKQSVNVYAQDSGVKIIGKCSCPVGRNCKHVISSALCYLDEASVEEQNAPELSANSYSEADDWLKRLQCSFLDIPKDDYEKSTVLLYSLHLSKNEKEVELSVFTARTLKSGGYGKVNRARVNSLFNQHRPPEYIRSADKEAIQLFRLLSEGVKSTAPLRGKLGLLVLEAAISTGRCYWQRSFKRALSFGQMRELKIAWQEELLYAQIKLDAGEKSFLINTKPPFYVDTQTKQVAKLETTLTTEQLNHLLRAPRLDKEEVEEFALRVEQKLPNLKIQAPVTLELKEYEAEKIAPILYLSKRENSYGIDFWFSYDDFKVKAYEQGGSFIVLNEKLRVARDLNFEARFKTEIEAFGFRYEAGLLRTNILGVWKTFLEELPRLKEEGYSVEKASNFKLDFHAVNRVDVKVEETSHWFNMRMDIKVKQRQLQLLPILSKLLEEGIDLEKEKEVYFELEQEQFIALDAELLKPILKTFYELLDKPNAEGFKLKKFEAKVLDNFNSGFNIDNPTSLKKIQDELKKPFEMPKKIEGLQAELRDYQKEGVAWMQFLRRYHFGGILADDMGLGKTIQTLAHLQLEKESGRLNKPCLIIAPTSLLGNWQAEASKFTPNLRTSLYYGTNREEILDNIKQFDLIITTYTVVNIDLKKLKEVEFYYLVLDEAQKIKNAKTSSAKAIKALVSDFCIALSGTPMENHLGELHSIFDTVMPEFLGSLKTFKTLYQNPIEKSNDIKTRERLNARIKPFMLRRTKERVAKELPAKTQMVRAVAFEAEQARLYETIRVSMEKSVRETIKTMGLASSHISILAALLKLRQVCCDPRLLKIEEAQKIHHSAKLEMLMELVLELREEGRKILIFSQFTTMLEIIEEAMIKEAINYSKLTGATRKRQEQIDKFSQGESEVFLISLKAGGVGLNLTAADTIIHYDPWWNPAVQDQATDRAYRIGQDKPVFVYQLIIKNSVEEKIIQMQKDKKELANAIYEGKEKGFSKMSEKDLLELFK